MKMKKVMVRAWEIAKAAVVKFGGKVKEYFAQALAMAWNEAKGAVAVVKEIGFKEIATKQGEFYFIVNTGVEVSRVYTEKDHNGTYDVKTPMEAVRTGKEKNTGRDIEMHMFGADEAYEVEMKSADETLRFKLSRGKLVWV